MKQAKFKNGMWVLSLLMISLLIASCQSKDTLYGPPSEKPKVNPLLDNAPVSGSCAMSYPKIGTFNKVVPDSSGGSPFTQISISNVKTLDSNPFDEDAKGIINNNIINIDKYEEIVQQYIENSNQFPNVPEDDWAKDEVKIFTEAINKVSIKKGDEFQKPSIIVNGFPMNFCGYGFLGIFSSNGKLENAVIRDSYNSYSYKGETIEVKLGSQTDCGQYTCTVEANFKVGEEEFTLPIGGTHLPKSENIKSIILLYASVDKQGAPVLSVGSNSQIIYVIDFDFEHGSKVGDVI